MKKIWKHFEGWVTALRSNIFSWARIKLTALYLGIIVLFLAIYSMAMYVSLLHSMRHQVIFENTIDIIQYQIVLIDVFIFTFAAIASYWLSGVTLRPIKRALEAQESFSADASHELRTPLAVIKTDIEVLLRSKVQLPEEATAVLKSNLEEINTLSSMTHDLLELARGQKGIAEKIALSNMVEEEVGSLRSLALQKNITLNIHQEGDIMVFAEKEALRRVFKNVIANAITYTLEGGIVDVSIKNHHNRAIVVIKDTGIGIAQKALHHIFDRFYKADNARIATNAGSGLGLAIAKKSIEQCSGSIGIQSVVGEGTTVTITMPALKA